MNSSQSSVVPQSNHQIYAENRHRLIVGEVFLNNIYIPRMRIASVAEGGFVVVVRQP